MIISDLSLNNIIRESIESVLREKKKKRKKVVKKKLVHLKLKYPKKTRKI